MAPKEFRVSWWWFAVPVIAVFELFFQWQIPQREPSEEDWKAAVRFVAQEKQQRDVVVVAPDWASPIARMHLGKHLSQDEFGRFDTSRYEHLIEISVNGARSDEGKDLKPDQERAFGRLTVRRFLLKQDKPHVLYDFLQRLDHARVRGAKRIRKGFLIDPEFSPRRVIQVPLTNKGISLTYGDVPLGGGLYGYGIIDYKNGKFDKGGPVRLSVSVDGQEIGETLIHNLDVNRPFYFDLPGANRGTVRFHIAADDNFKRQFGFVADVRTSAGEGK